MDLDKTLLMEDGSIPDAVVEMTAVWKLVLKNLTGKSNPPCRDAAR